MSLERRKRRALERLLAKQEKQVLHLHAKTETRLAGFKIIDKNGNDVTEERTHALPN